MTPPRRILLLLLAFSTSLHATANPAPACRPNILWISLEDIGPMMGCFGDKYARTPVFDKLAAEGIRYLNAHSVAPVCSTSRSSIITGIYPSTLGTQHHRSNVGKPPAFMKMLPNLMGEAGYFTTNNSKKDYNISGDRWHVSSRSAHWRNQPEPANPFFSVFNFTECHSSITKIPEDVIVRKRLNRLKAEDFHDLANVAIPPYHPDAPEFRKAWARYYDAVTQVDYRAGELIAQLKEDGLWEVTIVVVWADHGVGMPRGKHNPWEQGTLVPLIVRFPEKYQHLAPAKPGSTVDGLVSLIDLGPSTLAMAGQPTPEWMQGRNLLCKTGDGRIAYREYLIGMRDRLDSRFEMVRTVRDKRFRYQRNFYPNLPYKPHEDYAFNAPVLKKWVAMARAGELVGPQAMMNLRFKPVEELYDSHNDPHMIHNVLEDPKYAEVVSKMRGRLYDWMLETRDLGLLDETETLARAKAHPSHWDLGQAIQNFPEILETANLMTAGASAVPELLECAINEDPAIRFWAVLGLANLRSSNPNVHAALKVAAKDESISVAIAAADGLFNLGLYEDGLPAILSALRHPVPAARIRASCILDTQPPSANPHLQAAIPVLQEARKKLNVKGMRGIPYGLNQPFARAIKALSGEETYYRW